MSIWQTESWQNMLVASGQSEEYFIIEQNFKSPDSSESGLKVKVFVEKRKVSLGEYGLFVLGFEGKLDNRLEDNLKSLCREEKCLFIQVETIDYKTSLDYKAPSVLRTPPSTKEALSSPSKRGREPVTESRGSFKSRYYKKFIPPYTALIDLSQSEDEILAAMKPKGRYNIRLAEKKGVVVEQVEKHLGNIQKFHALMNETTLRDNFAGNSGEYYKIFLESLENSQLFFAYHESEIIAAGIFIAQGDVVTYYYGASSNKKRSLMAPYLLQWTAMIHAKKRNYKIYDFLGVAGDDEKDSPLSGVTDFKMKLSPKKTFVSESFLYINKNWKYQAIILLRKLRK